MEQGLEKKQIFFYEHSKSIIALILIFALVLRLKYLTINSALWFDEAEYLAMAKNWAFGIPFNIPDVRPILLPFFAFIFYKIGVSPEMPLRIIELIFSIGGVYLGYLLGKEIYNKQIGLLSAFFMSIFYLHIIFTTRILTDMPTTTLWTLAAYLFWKWHKDKSVFHIHLAALVIGLGILMRFPFGLIIIAFFLYLLIVKGLKFLKIKEIWTSIAVVFLVLVPYLLWFYMKFNKIAIISTGGYYDYVFLLWDYVKVYYTYFYSPAYVLFLLFLIGLGAFLFKLVIGLDLIRKNSSLQKKLFILLLFIVPFAYFGFVNQLEPRYLFYTFPSAFLIISFIVSSVYNYIEEHNKHIAIVAIVLLLTFSAVYQIRFADDEISTRKDSYLEYKFAGKWIKDNSDSDDVILSDGAAQLAYYSEREVIGWGDKEDFNELINERKPRYVLLSKSERSPEWAYEVPLNNPEVFVFIFGYDNSGNILYDKDQLALLRAYEVKY